MDPVQAMGLPHEAKSLATHINPRHTAAPRALLVYSPMTERIALLVALEYFIHYLRGSDCSVSEFFRREIERLNRRLALRFACTGPWNDLLWSGRIDD